MTFTLGTLTFGGYILFETATETCVMMTGDWQTVRIPKGVAPGEIAIRAAVKQNLGPR